MNLVGMVFTVDMFTLPQHSKDKQACRLEQGTCAMF